MNVEEIVKSISRSAALEFLALESPEWISERQAKKLYGINLQKWVGAGLVQPSISDTGRIDYEAHRLKALHTLFMNGKDLYECTRLFQFECDSVAKARTAILTER